MASKRILLNENPATSGSNAIIATVDVSSISDVLILLTPATQNLTAVSIEVDAGNGEWGEYNLTIAPITAGNTSRPIEITSLAAQRLRVKATAAGVGTCRVTISGRE
jgi:hypothetical protein